MEIGIHYTINLLDTCLDSLCIGDSDTEIYSAKSVSTLGIGLA